MFALIDCEHMFGYTRNNKKVREDTDMPLINALLFLVLAGTGLTGYGMMRHFEKLEAKRYVEWQDLLDVTEPVPLPQATNVKPLSARYRKAG